MLFFYVNHIPPNLTVIFKLHVITCVFCLIEIFFILETQQCCRNVKGKICLEKKAACSIKHIMKIIGINYGGCTPFAHIFIKHSRPLGTFVQPVCAMFLIGSWHVCAKRLFSVSIYSRVKGFYNKCQVKL